MHSAESPAKSKLLPVHWLNGAVLTPYVASIYPFAARKKSCTPLLACASVRLCGSVGLSPTLPAALDVKVRAPSSTMMLDVIAFSEAARSGVL